MNLLQGVVRDGHVEAGDLRFVREGQGDSEVVVGIRPEGMRPVGELDGGPGLALQVDVVEPLGDEVLVHGRVAARDAGVRIEPEEATLLVQISDRAAMTVRLAPDARPAEEAPCTSTSTRRPCICSTRRPAPRSSWLSGLCRELLGEELQRGLCLHLLLPAHVDPSLREERARLGRDLERLLRLHFIDSSTIRLPSG